MGNRRPSLRHASHEAKEGLSSQRSRRPAGKDAIRAMCHYCNAPIEQGRGPRRQLATTLQRTSQSATTAVSCKLYTLPARVRV